jgi:hypothetical protein
MNELPAYEQIIAEKLEGIEIPDMADAIWGRIEAALDVEMPVEAPPQGTPFYKHPDTWVIIAMIIALFFLPHKRKAAPPVEKKLPQQTAPVVKPDTVMKRKVLIPLKLKPLVDTLVTDTPVVIYDSSLNLPPIPDTAKVVKPTPKRKYGVEVSDSDYRFKITPK